MPYVACQHWGDAARIPMTDDAVLALIRQHFAGIDAMYLCPAIPGKKELAARSVHARHLPSDERVLALFDDTVFGSGDDGFLVTARRLCWKNVAGRAQMIEWQHVAPDRMYADRRKLVLGTQAIELAGDESVLDVLDACEAAFHVLAFSARLPADEADQADAANANGGSGVVLSSESEPDPDATDQLPTLRPSGPPAPLESEVAPRSDPKPAIANATPPPPHAVTYASYVVHASSQKAPKFACWHCHTPLHWNTPQCARCSAWPTPQGWLRTA
jgi:hypothetical protein